MGRPRTCDCGSCLKCRRRDYMRAWYQRQSRDKKRQIVLARNPDLVREADRQRYYRSPESRKARMKEWASRNRSRRHRYLALSSERHPEKIEARRQVMVAVRDGLLVRQPCEECGSTKWVEGHHPDYSKPLDVQWLCSRHHGDVHRHLNAAARQA